MKLLGYIVIVATYITVVFVGLHFVYKMNLDDKVVIALSW